MNNYITKIQINNLYHLHDLTIDIANPTAPHLILTGKNGSGKTVLLNAIADFVDKIKNQSSLSFLNLAKKIEKYKKEIIPSYPEGSNNLYYAEKELKKVQEEYDKLYGKVDISFDNGYEFIDAYLKDDFIIAFYQAARKTEIREPLNPTKPILTSHGDIRRNLTRELLNFLSDLKIQEALARNEDLSGEADKIKQWFDNFVGILRTFFEDDNLTLKFNYKDYSFTICTDGKEFKFTEMSDGFVAILDVVADLILRMQAGGTLTTEFSKPGIVFIDEIETHLHLKLQKMILPTLTTIFPNIQFIVTSHSPFVLSSISNATAYDLEHHEPITNLTEYSYQALTEGYFGVSTDSDYARQRYNELETLLKKDRLSEGELVIIKQIFEDYKKIPEAISPELVGAYRQLEITYNSKIRDIFGQ